MKTRVSSFARRQIVGSLGVIAIVLGLTTASLAQGVVLNELMARNTQTLADEDGEFPDWMELFNPTAGRIELTGYGLSDKPDQPFRWIFPPFSVAPGGYAILFASGKDRTGSNSAGGGTAGAPHPHTNFSLDAAGEFLVLTSPEGQVVDSVRFGAMPADVSYGRSPAAAASWQYFAQPTPGGPNAAVGFEQVAPAPSFSDPGGRYEPAVLLKLATDEPDVFIHYTLDGSVPTERSTRFNREIWLTETSVVRARAFGPDLMPGPVVTHTYLIREDRYLPVLSLTTEPSHLWDWQTGIYVLGPNAQSANPHFGANFWQDWEIPIHIELIETDGTRAFGIDGGGKISGQWSRAHPQKSMSLYARSRYGAPSIDYPLFPDRPATRYEGFMLRNSGNDWNRTHMRDAFMQRLVGATQNDVQAYRPVVVYLNGAYWGILNMREKVNEHYAAALDGVGPDDIDLLEGMAPPALQTLHGSAIDYVALLDFVTRENMTSEAALNEVRRRMDVDNFIDYQIAEIFFDNRDWPGNNVKIRRARAGEGLWRWIIYDTDFGFGIWNRNAYTENTLAFATDGNGPDWPNPPWSTLLLRRLLRNGDFRRDFVNRFADFLNVHFEERRMLAVLEEMRAAVAPEMPRHKQRWGGTVQNWEDALDVMRGFARGRRAPMVSHLRAYFGLSGDVPVTLRVEPEGAGTIRIHRERIRTFPWTGSYFRGLPVTVTALPAPGYRFVGWGGSRDYSDRSVGIDPALSPLLVARFVADANLTQAVVINEIMVRSAPDMDSGDWVELMNRSSDAVEVSGWTFTDERDDRGFTLPSGTTIPAGEYLVLCRDRARFAEVHPHASPCEGDWGFGLSGSGELIRLYDGVGMLVDSLVYGTEPPWPTEANGGGASLELVDPFADNAYPSSWRGSSVRGGTPGVPNSVSVSSEDLVPSRPGGDLLVAYPNPFTTRTLLVYHLPGEAHVSIRIYDVLGRLVARLVDENRASGDGRIEWDASGLPAGLYLAAFTVDGERCVTRRLVLSR